MGMTFSQMGGTLFMRGDIIIIMLTYLVMVESHGDWGIEHSVLSRQKVLPYIDKIIQ